MKCILKRPKRYRVTLNSTHQKNMRNHVTQTQCTGGTRSTYLVQARPDRVFHVERVKPTRTKPPTQSQLLKGTNTFLRNPGFMTATTSGYFTHEQMRT
jgi:hypothetical protein